ncbi:hypothetical protein GCM10011409_19910 [Lentibacillus populi]|uniref:Uncharacterized protein n=1 Tax=Lentibacillus populi TaxID=1827502 RepID=A0A9W5X5U7_9BACI|nr:hypothetical protein GCM10011409_19910 [Lentibacillus populi]
MAGEPLRIITGGFPEIKRATQPERRADCIKHLDHIVETGKYEVQGERKFVIDSPAGEVNAYA